MSLGRVSVSSIRFLRLNALSYHFGLHRISGAEPRYSQSINRKWILIPTSNGHFRSEVFDGFQLELTLTFQLRKRPFFIIEILFYVSKILCKIRSFKIIFPLLHSSFMKALRRSREYILSGCLVIKHGNRRLVASFLHIIFTNEP